MLQRVAVQKLHGDEMLVLVGVNFVDGADIGMVQGGRSFGFALKAAECLWVCGYLFGQELEGHEPAELHVLSLVHHTHSTTAKFFDDAIVRDGLANHREEDSFVGNLRWAAWSKSTSDA
jgi:hypothetical protein